MGIEYSKKGVYSSFVVNQEKFCKLYNTANIWKHSNILIPIKLRFLTKRDTPGKYCANLENDLLYSPQYYFKVAIENRLFFYPRDVLIAVDKEFRPTPDCEKWLHEVWRILHGRKEWEDRFSERERRNDIKRNT